MELSKVRAREEIIAKFHDGQIIAIGGQTGQYMPERLIQCVLDSGARHLTIYSIDTSDPGTGVGRLIRAGVVDRIITTHVGTNPETNAQIQAGTLRAEFSPMGSFIERIRCGGLGLGGVLTPVGIDTLVEESPFCLGRQTIDGKDYLLMKPVHADFALLGAYKCDEFGNCWYKGTMRNFNVVMATAADTVIAECEYIVPVGEIEPENVHTYGMCVDYIVEGDRK